MALHTDWDRQEEDLRRWVGGYTRRPASELLSTSPGWYGDVMCRQKGGLGRRRSSWSKRFLVAHPDRPVQVGSSAVQALIVYKHAKVCAVYLVRLLYARIQLCFAS